MQKLEYQDALGKPNEKAYPIPDGYTGIDVSVTVTDDGVILKIGSKSIILSPKGARDLALTLRQSSNRVEREMFSRLGKRNK